MRPPGRAGTMAVQVRSGRGAGGLRFMLLVERDLLLDGDVLSRSGSPSALQFAMSGTASRWCLASDSGSDRHARSRFRRPVAPVKTPARPPVEASETPAGARTRTTRRPRRADPCGADVGGSHRLLDLRYACAPAASRVAREHVRQHERERGGDERGDADYAVSERRREVAVR